MKHGGDIYTASEFIKKSLYEIIDMSSSVNPLPLPEKIKRKIIENIPLLHKYPDTEARAFRKTLSELYSVPFENIVCGNGSTELIYLIVRALKPESVLILEPTFTEYERACRINEIKSVKRVFTINQDEIFKKLKKEIEKTRFDMVFICNPNNPTGWILDKREILKLASNNKNSIFLIDEAFIDFVPDQSLIRESVSSNIVVLRSLTKFYGLAGLRFGYAVGKSEIIKKIKTYRYPWSINSLAQWIAEDIIRDEDFKNKSLEYFKRQKDFFEYSLNELKLNYFPSVANFYLIEIQKKGIFQFMLEKGILIRNCSDFYGLNESFIRVSVKTSTENERFFRELKKFLGILE
ncbi:threonine-phosphate decarboxylase [Thermodesulfovibrio aggregans]|uniref:threonine-phosphate decarboxylase n=1 Tax=Thermodesulfovibrio aggregans TaxID=86166 RepID=A0A0U9IAS5_9BACT|nr:threonine-phosphate decarboxylase CobD [Thermodesulfovibrio aggregans]GAQ95414.1 threonine-phosphate decarboxylase [Thermodesulfovibrio aggregans]